MLTFDKWLGEWKADAAPGEPDEKTLDAMQDAWRGAREGMVEEEWLDLLNDIAKKLGLDPGRDLHEILTVLDERLK